MNNYYKPGPQSPSNSVFVAASYARDGATSWAPAKWYVNGNIMEGNSAATEDNWKAMNAETYSLDEIRADERIVTETPYYKYNSVLGNEGEYDPALYMLTDIQTAEDAYNTVLENAGTINRDVIEQRVINDVKTGNPKYTGSKSNKKGIIDSVNDAEGFGLDHGNEKAPADTDGDGMPDEWEKEHGLNANNAADRNLRNAEGYTALEVYLNGLMGELLDDDFTSGITQAVTEKPEISYNSSNNTLTVSENAIGATLRVFTTDGKQLAQMRITSATTQLNSLPKGVVLLYVSGNNLCPRILKVNK